MQDHELDAYLDGADVTAEQRHTLLAAAAQIDARWPEPDDSDEREAAFAAATMIVLSDAQVGEIRRDAIEAQGALVRARAAQVGAALALAGEYSSEQGLADALGVTRATVRSWLGK